MLDGCGMSISYRIAAPVVVLGMLSLAVTLWLAWALASPQAAGGAGGPTASTAVAHPVVSAVAGGVEGETSRQSAATRLGAAALGMLAVATFALSLWAAAYARRLAAEMARLPDDLRALAGSDGGKPLAGERRGDELGELARDLRAFAGAVSELSQSRAEMERMALTDPLTGLPNRRGLHDFLARLARRRGWSDRAALGVMHIDIDHFKTINDANGHEIGDHVLREATRRMAMVIRDTDILARVGGDEFVIVAQGIGSSSALEGLACRVLRQFGTPVAAGERAVQVTVSIGAVLGGRRGRLPDPRRLLVSADVALASAKLGGRNRVALFTSGMWRDARRQQEQVAEIRGGIERGEFHVWFRPVVDLAAGRTVALDLVPRWHHPVRGLLPARAFLPAAEACGLTEAMAVPMLEGAFRAAAAWRGAGLAVPPLHIGMSRSLLVSPTIVDRIVWMLDDARIEPAAIEFAVAEHCCSGRGADAVHDSLQRLSGLGAGLIVDEFGSVDGALGNITKLGAGSIRLNLARTTGLADGDEAGDAAAEARIRALLPAIVGIGSSLGVRVLVKGIGKPSQIDRLRARGFSRFEGEAVAPAMDAAATAAWIATAAAQPLRLASA